MRIVNKISTSFNLAIITSVFFCGIANFAQANSDFNSFDYISEEQLQKSYKQAVERYKKTDIQPQPQAQIQIQPQLQTNTAPSLSSNSSVEDEIDRLLKAVNNANEPTQPPKSQAEILLKSATKPALRSGQQNDNFANNDVTIISKVAYNTHQSIPPQGYASLDGLNIAIDMDGQTIREIIDSVVNKASVKTGKWNVKWRLRKEHEYILKEKVNLTAETNFSNFMDYLVDRINNMTGIRLFVTVFDASRIIVISDTYY